LGYENFFPQFGSLYYRILNYHAAHDISHAVMDNPLVGCTSFAAWSNATSNGHLIVGRNFDFDAGECFDKNKIVMFVQPDEGLSYISVAWPGMIGVVSGINEAKIAVTINAGQSESSRMIGTPVSLVMREVLQYCSTIEEAVELLRKSYVFVADSYLIADGKTGKAIIVEKTPAKTAVVKPAKDYIICANHFLSDELKNDLSNLEYMKQGTSVQRYDRMEQLIGNHYGKIDIEITASILRDRTIGTMSDSLGNALAINPLIATHSVIIDVTQAVIWVSAYPHQLGHYVPFSVESFDEESQYNTIEADALLDSEEYINYQKAIQLQQNAKKTQDDKKAIALLKESDDLNPRDYISAMMLGELYYKTGQYETAQHYLLEAKKRLPAYEIERQDIENLLKKISEQSLKSN
jgi:tetratricopeptide (TPR) repeat protein